MKRIREKLTYANVMSTFAVFLLLGGAAYAAKKISSKDIKKGAVKTKALAKNAVNSKKIKDGGVAAVDLGSAIPGAKLADGSVPVAKLPAEQGLQTPAFGNGGEGDCTWIDGASQIPGINPAGYRIDRFGTVHLSGVVASQANAGVGDEECGATAPEPEDLVEDATVFTLPPAYRPEHTIIEVGVSNGNLFIAGDEPFTFGGDVLPAGAVVIPAPPTTELLEGISFPAASTGLVPGKKAAAASDPVMKAQIEKAFGL